MKPYYQRPNFTLYLGNSLELVKQLKDKYKLIFIDPPYFLSNDGITCESGKMVSVNKGKWDKSLGFQENVKYTEEWVHLCKKILEERGTIWSCGTHHNIHYIGYVLQRNKFDIINDITWFKPNAAPHLAAKAFAHSHESLIWANRQGEKYEMNYELMKNWQDSSDVIKNRGKKNSQMRSVWWIPATSSKEKWMYCRKCKIFFRGVQYKLHKSHKKEVVKHKTQKPIELLRRIIAACTNKGDNVLDMFNGTGTTGIVAEKLGRNYTGIDTEQMYLDITIRRYEDPLKNKLVKTYTKIGTGIESFM